MRHVVNSLSGIDDDGGFELPAAALVVVYCALTVAADACVQLQQSAWGRLFYKITQRVSLALFEHLHALSMRWHLQRKTGEVLTVVNQGVGAVGNLLQIVTFQIFGTVLELVMTSVVFFNVGVPAISLCVTAGAALYTGYTIVLTQLRTVQRREQNAANQESQELVVDSLLNFETVKVFASEGREAKRFDGLTTRLAALQTSAQDSLSWLNCGQTLAMQLGMAGGLLIACMRTAEGRTTVGDFVMVQLYIVQLFQPLANLGGSYRMLMQAIADVEKTAELLHVPREVIDEADAVDLARIVREAPPERRDVRFDDDTVLFNATVRFNLMYSAPEATDAQVLAACRLARVDDFIGRLEAGFETAVGERGLRLSGGEKQRLGLARAVLREPAVLVLDEATSALDSHTEREVQAALDDASRGRCTLSIAHRLSTIVSCDEVVVLRAGVVVERGTHDGLLSARGLYASLWSKQLAEQTEPSGRSNGPSAPWSMWPWPAPTNGAMHGEDESGAADEARGTPASIDTPSAAAAVHAGRASSLQPPSRAEECKAQVEIRMPPDAAAMFKRRTLTPLIERVTAFIDDHGGQQPEGTRADLPSGSPNVGPSGRSSVYDRQHSWLNRQMKQVSSLFLSGKFSDETLAAASLEAAERAAPPKAPHHPPPGRYVPPDVALTADQGSRTPPDGTPPDGPPSSADEPSEPAPSKNANERAELDFRFLIDLWLLVHIGIDRHPLAVLLSELTFATALTALVLWLLPIPASYLVTSAEVNRLVGSAVVGLIVALALILPLWHVGRRAGARHVPLVAHLRRRSLPLLFLCVQTYNIAGFFVAITPSLIYQALIAEPRQCGKVPALLGRALGYICAVTVCKALVGVGKESAALLWRAELTRFMHERYLRRGAHYHMGLLQPSVDNPDQRIARELDLWSASLADLFVAVSTSLFNVVWYTIQTWLITGWHGPALILVFFLASATVTRLVASPVAALTARCQAAEGDFRAMHATLLQASEATAMCSNGEAEGVALGESLGALLRLRWQLLLRRGLLGLATIFFEYNGSIVNYVAVGLALCGGMYDDRSASDLSSIVSRGSTFAITMVFGLTQLVAAVGTAAELSGHTRRVAALLRGLEHVEATTSSWRRREEEEWRPGQEHAHAHAQGAEDARAEGDAEGKGESKGEGSGVRGRRRLSKEGGGEPLLEGRRLCVSVPPMQSKPYGVGGSSALRMSSSSAMLSRVELLSAVELCVRAGGSVLVRGAAGVGKTALLRTICGLWPLGERSEAAPPGQGAELVCVPPLWNRSARHAGSPTYLVLPQSAPLRPGMDTSLYEQLVYPLLERDDAHEACCDALEAVGLSGLIDRLGGLHTPHSRREWHAALSPGQRQLLVCARIFVHRPALVLLDEATSAMPAANEGRIYAKLRALGIAYVSIGHRASLEQHHDDIVDL